MTPSGERPVSKNSIDAMLSGGGEMGALIRSIDWSRTPLGPMVDWPQSLQTAVSICLFSRFPILIWWGPEYVKIYNDAYRPILGANKHPQAMGQRGQETWAEIWNIIGPMLESVYQDGLATWSEDQMLPMDRFGFTEETYFTFSYSPIFDESGSVGGIFTAVTETTKQVLGERRLKILYELSDIADDGKTVEQACQLAANVLTHFPADISFALFYRLDAPDANSARLVASAGIPADSDLYIPVLDRESLWPLASDETVKIDNLPAHFQRIPSRHWPETSRTALILPISGGFMVIGISPSLALDQDYWSFCDLVAAHVTTAITNAQATEAEHKRLEALAELDRAKTEFFSNVSHEFRTPLTLLLGPLQDMLQNDVDPSQRENLRLIHRNSLRLLKLVNTLLEFSRIQSNRIHASFEPTDLATLTADLASSFRSAVERSGLRLVIDCPPLPQAVYVDQEMWEKIVLNLLSNAFKFTFEGEITVCLRATEHEAQLIVHDTGIGISAADLPHIFERFHRVRGAHARTYEGSGIGLALVMELVRLHGGDVVATSEPGVGTAFTISIPFGLAHLPPEQIGVQRTLPSTASGALPYVAEAMQWVSENHSLPDKEKVENPVTPLHHAKGLGLGGEVARILVVDDNADMRGYLQRLLEAEYQVETANDGIAALADIHHNPPDLILADVMMPNLDGFGLLQQIRTNPETSTIPLILLSARAGEETRIDGLVAGADDYVVKPFSSRELLARIDAQLQLNRLRKEVRASKATIENIIESIADPFYVLDENQCFIYVNARQQELWNMRREELIGKNIWEVFPQGIATRAYGEIQNAIANQKPAAFETFSNFLNAWVEVNVYPSSRGVAVYFRDITERKRVESDLQETKERLRLVMYSATDYAIYALDPEGCVYIWSAGAERVFGYTESEIMGKHVEILYLPEDRARHLPAQEMQKAIEFGYVENERWLMRKDGSSFYASGMVRLIHDDSGNFRGFARVSRDTTARKLIEEERARLNTLLEAERQRLASIVANVPGIIWESHFDPRTETVHITFISAYVETLLGYTVEEALSTPNFWDSVIHPDDVQQVNEKAEQTRYTGGTQIAIFRVVHKDGHVIDLEAHVTVIPDNVHGRQVRGVMMDITERQRFSQVQARYAQMLRRSNEELQQFAYIASHDLQEPLRMVTSYLQLLEKRYGDQLEADAHEFIEFAIGGATRMRELITALLDYSRIERDEKTFEEFPAQTALDSTLSTLALKIEDSGAVITHDTLPAIRADPVQITQLFQNLLSNAIKFHGENPPRIHIGVARKDGEWQFSVRDNGIGIPPEGIDRIFVIFQRLHSRTAYPGSGMGLAICKKVVERHGGRIWVESVPGEGATFYFTIPI